MQFTAVNVLSYYSVLHNVLHSVNTVNSVSVQGSALPVILQPTTAASIRARTT